MKTAKKKDPLYLEVKRGIQRAIETGRIATDGKLPSEDALSEMFSVSRVTVRSALKLLEADGVISARHGIGSFVNYAAVTGTRMRIDLAKGFFNLIMDSGHVPSIAKAELESTTLPEDVRRSLLLPEGSEGYALTRLFLGDGMPAFYVTEYLPVAYLKKEPESSDMPESIYQIAELYCADPIEYSNMGIYAEIADGSLRSAMELDGSKRALVKLKEIHHSKSNKPIIYSDIYVNDDIIHFQVRRKKAY